MMLEDVEALLTRWMPSQRWYATKNDRAVLENLELRDSCTCPDGTKVVDAFVTERLGSGAAVVYHVPMVHRFDDDGIPPHAVVGVLPDGTFLVDGPWDHRYVRRLLPDYEGLAHRVITGEQSNTSIVIEADPLVIVKIFRVLADGVNPDVEVTKALSERQLTHVPAFVTSRRTTWRRGPRLEAGTLWVATEFVEDGEDAWSLALDAVRENRDIDAAGLGRAVAEVHHALAEAFPVASDAEADQLVRTWQRRAALALAELPELEPLRTRIRDVYDAAASVPWPELQRIHGDLHLGQILWSPSRGWVLLDFEGEPLRPLAERRLPDLTLRDVAGMLRSFDYAGGADPDDAARTWSERQRQSFLDGYADPAPVPELLRALELDKALYEARYEAGNRPDWLPIPLRAVHRLLESPEA